MLKRMIELEPIIWVLVGGATFFSLLLFASEAWFRDDPQFFQVISNLLSGVVGALLVRVRQGQSAQPTGQLPDAAPIPSGEKQ